MKKVLTVYVTPLEMDSAEYHLVDLPAAQDRLDTLLLEMNKGFPLYTEVSDYCGREYLADHMPEDMDLKRSERRLVQCVLLRQRKIVLAGQRTEVSAGAWQDTLRLLPRYGRS